MQVEVPLGGQFEYRNTRSPAGHSCSTAIARRLGTTGEVPES
jgi:hypothetical protein